MNSEIRARKKKFAALVTVVMLVMCNVMPAFAATHTADEWMRYGSFDRTQDYYVNPGDEIQISGTHTLYEYAYYRIVYYDENNNEIKEVKSSTADEQYDDGGYYFAHNVVDYSDIMGESDKSKLFKNWKVTDVYKSGGYGGKVYLTAQFYDELNVVYHLPEGAVNSPDNLSTYPQGKSDIILGNASMEGYTFDGWYLDAEFTLPTASIDATQTGEVILYAKFTLNPPTDPGDGDEPGNGEEPGDGEEPGNEEDPGNNEKPENPGNTETPSDNDPKLGEDNIAVLLTGLTGLAGLGIFTMTLKKRRKSEQN